MIFACAVFCPITLLHPSAAVCQISDHFGADSSGEVSMALGLASYSLRDRHSSSMACSLDMLQFLFHHPPNRFQHMVLKRYGAKRGKKYVSRRSCLHAIKLKIDCNNYNVVSNYSTSSGFVMFSNNETISTLLLMLIKHLLVSRFNYWHGLKWSHLKLFIYPPLRFCFVLPFISNAPTSSP